MSKATVDIAAYPLLPYPLLPRVLRRVNVEFHPAGIDHAIRCMSADWLSVGIIVIIMAPPFLFRLLFLLITE
jgi:hypothetical protein